MRIAIVDESAARASVIREGLASLDDCEIFVVTERRGLVARTGEIAPDVVLMDLGNPSRDVEIPGGYFSPSSFGDLVRASGARTLRVTWPLHVHAPWLRAFAPSEMQLAAALEPLHRPERR